MITSGKGVNKESNPFLWNLLTNQNTEVKDAATETDSDKNIEGKKKNQVSLPTIIHNADGPNISANEVVNIAPGEGQLPG